MQSNTLCNSLKKFASMQSCKVNIDSTIASDSACNTKVQYYQDIADIQKFFQDCNWLADFLEAAADGSHTNHFVAVEENAKHHALFIFQTVAINTDDVFSYLSHQPKFGAKFFTKIAKKIVRKKQYQVLVNGSPSLTGDFGYVTLSRQNRRHLQYQLALDCMIQKTKFDFIVVKDLSPADSKNENVYPKHLAFQVDPNMLIRCCYKDMADYLASLKAKYRQRYISTMKKSSDIEGRTLTQSDVLKYEQQMNKLFRGILKNDKFGLGQPGDSYFSSLAELDRIHFTGYFKNETFVAFRTTLFTDNDSMAHFVGYNEQINIENKIYLRMLYDYIEEAIQKGVEHLHLGRTALEIKSSVGAVRQDLDLMVYSRNWFIRKLANMFFSRLHATRFVSRSPFKS